ncbi:hypothetical protein HY357_02720 [Candidatus Roizmanbacteria bacterium]|nr:hypothetical protein [Candidatus Roizmanbacteria bacterium]
MSIGRGELHPISDINQVAPHQKFVPTYWMIERKPPAIAASYPLSPIRKALKHYLGGHVKLDGDWIPDSIKDLRAKSISGVIGGPLTFFTENIFAGRQEYAPDTTAIMEYDGSVHVHGYGVKAPPIPLKFLPGFRDGYAYIGELEMIGYQRHSEPVVKATLDRSMRFTINPLVVFEPKDLPATNSLNDEEMAKLGIVALKQLLEAFRSAISSGISYAPNYDRGFGA